MKNIKALYAVGCGLGGGMIGYFASQLNSFSGAALFALGVAILVFSAVKLAK